MYVLKRFLPHFIIFLVVCVLSSVVVITDNSAVVSSAITFERQIIIDAGHGGLTNTTH